MTKTCSRCKEDLAVTLFRKRAKSSDGLAVWCTPCFAAYDRERYATGDKARKENNRLARLKERQTALWQILTTSECKNCGNADPEVLEFDHRDPAEKSNDISQMLFTHSWVKIKAEIDKCDVLCANCHRKRTIRQFGTWRGMMV